MVFAFKFGFLKFKSGKTEKKNTMNIENNKRCTNCNLLLSEHTKNELCYSCNMQRNS